MIEYRDAFRWSLEELAANLTDCFEDYVIPATFSPALLAFLLRVEGLDLGSSILAVEDGKMIGALMVGRRGRLSRVAAMAVAKSHRGHGLGTQLMERAVFEAKARGDNKMMLEAIEHNSGAIAFYERNGFRIRYRLISAQIPMPNPGEVAAREISFEQLASLLLERGEAAAPWEMGAASALQMASPIRAFGHLDMGVAVAPSGDDGLLCRSMALTGQDDAAKLKSLLQALAHTFPGRLFRIPPYFPEPEFRAVFEGAGLELQSLNQVQMELEL